MRRYLFGKDVDGTAYVVFGIMDGNVKKSLPHSLTRVPVSSLLFQFSAKYTFHASKKARQNLTWVCWITGYKGRRAGHTEKGSDHSNFQY